MTLKGIYEIRFVPSAIELPIVGGLYATGEAINAPILALPLNPSVHGEQKWSVNAIPGKPDTYHITYPGVYADGAPGFGLGEEHHRGHNEPVRLTHHHAEWVITEVDAANSVYRIAEPSTMVGAVHAVTEQDGRLLVKAYPVIQHMPPLPRWHFINVYSIQGPE